MDKITDPFEFDRHIEAVRENAAGLPTTQGHLIDLLAKLIEDALADLTGEKFATPRGMGDLDSADGIFHLLTDYPAHVPPGKFFREAFLTTNEEAAAHYLSALYLARDSLRMDFGLPEESIREIEATGRELLTWRLHGPAFEHGKRKRQATQAGKIGAAIKAKRQKPRIDAWHAKIQKRAKSMKGSYSKTEALDVLEREFPGYSRRQLSNIVSSVFPPRPPRASSSQ